MDKQVTAKIEIPKTPMKAIRAKCMECSCGSYKEIKQCTAYTCPLREFRSGHRRKKQDS